MNTATRVPSVIASAYGTIGGFLRPWFLRGIPTIMRNTFASVERRTPCHAMIATEIIPPAMQVLHTTRSTIGQPTIAPTAAISFMSPPPTTPRRQNGRNNPPAIASPRTESLSPSKSFSIKAAPRPSAMAPSVSQLGILLAFISP